MNGIGSDRMRLEHSSWLQVQRYFTHHDLVVLPIGSTENHGSHMALGTDLLVPDYIAGELDKQLEILITPVMPFGAADHHSSFPGTLSIGVDGLYLVLSKICEDLWRYGARRFVFLNGHGGNNPALSKVGLELNQKGGISAQLNWWTVAGELNPAWKGGHAAGEETAAMMAIYPQDVHMEDLMEFTPESPVPELQFVHGSTLSFEGIAIPVPRTTERFSQAGWYGNDHPSTANAQWGEEMLKATTDYFARFITAFEKMPL